MAIDTSDTPPEAPAVSRPPRPEEGYRVLIVEDDRDIAELLQSYLLELPARTSIVLDGGAGLEAISRGAYDLVVLDVRLPGLDGLEICRQTRMRGLIVPILIVSARGAESDRITGLERGADDYIVKPFSPGELRARARALLRRAAPRPTGGSAQASEVRLGDMRIDAVRREVHIGDRLIPVTQKEFELLYLFATHPGRAFSRAELLRAVWDLPYEGYEHNVTTHINRLREKIEEDPRNPRRILTGWGLGYKLAN